LVQSLSNNFHQIVSSQVQIAISALMGVNYAQSNVWHSANRIR